MAGGASETAVARDQRRIQRFGEGDIDGVAGCKIVPQIPNPGQQEYVRIAPDRQVGEIGQRFMSAPAANLSGPGVTAENVGGFGIDKMRSGKGVVGFEQPFRNGPGILRRQEQFEDYRGIDDNQRESRSCRIASAGGMVRVTRSRLAIRSRSSSTVGRAATSRISANR